MPHTNPPLPTPASAALALQALALEGFPVMRNVCDMKELRRLRLFEKAIDASARNPYTRARVTRWIVAGLGNGARVAAACANKGSARIAAGLLLSYPLLDPYPAIGKGGGHPDSSKPLLKMEVPMLLVHGALDAQTSPAELVAFCARYESERPAPAPAPAQPPAAPVEGAPPAAPEPTGTAVATQGALPAVPPRVVVLPGVDASFAAAEGDVAAAEKHAVLQARCSCARAAVLCW
jgi:pimeloyl-ACP methyl ester carboxylesterase